MKAALLAVEFLLVDSSLSVVEWVAATVLVWVDSS